MNRKLKGRKTKQANKQTEQEKRETVNAVIEDEQYLLGAVSFAKCDIQFYHEQTRVLAVGFTC